MRSNVAYFCPPFSPLSFVFFFWVFDDARPGQIIAYEQDRKIKLVPVKQGLKDKW